MDNLSKLSEQLAELMAEDGYTQTSLAQAIGIPNSNLSLYLADKSMPNFKDFVALIEFFHCSADFLIGRTEYPMRETRYKPVQPFGARLRNLLAEHNETQYSFIKSTKISWSVLHGWLTGKTLPSTDSLLKLAKHFGCSVDLLLGRELSS